ncbi:DNA (cytosine-5-)-methyltransferase [Streptomyces sp. NPDC000349]|uniref:DNA cytosine methyltransferase n=1 Tax=unclassified Streptomyces TaxID=2593676 RepID=UPI00278AB988|nr:DNA (cytosine-5-)-methyltransferase [Streptomyces sp. DSM 40167]MDQ0404020.1 DNA (cytosine-5)-methyltransferase 1 [Streptomyces sp. DSM 40167]
MPRSGQTRPRFASPLTSIEICAGAGGQAVGLHNAGFDHRALVEWDAHAVATLQANVGGWPGWDQRKADEIRPMDVKDFLDSDVRKKLGLEPGELDLLAGGVPCPPFSLAGHRLGPDDERDLFPAALDIISALLPKAVMIENVRGILEPPETFIKYRNSILDTLRDLGYLVPDIDQNQSATSQDVVMRKVWRRLDAKDFGVPQLRPRAILVAIHRSAVRPGSAGFQWPTGIKGDEVTAFEKLEKSMLARCKPFWDKNVDGERARDGEHSGRTVFEDWKRRITRASAAGKTVAPTLVGGSRKHGGADLGPTRAKRAWAELGVDGMGIANDPEGCAPERDLFRPAGPMLTVAQAAAIQGFPEEWKFQGRKTARYRQVGNAFPPPVAEAVGRAIAAALLPEYGDALTRDYEMEPAELAADESIPQQMEISVPADRLPQPPRKDRHSDFVGTGA